MKMKLMEEWKSSHEAAFSDLTTEEHDICEMVKRSISLGPTDRHIIPTYSELYFEKILFFQAQTKLIPRKNNSVYQLCCFLLKSSNPSVFLRTISTHHLYLLTEWLCLFSLLPIA